MRRIKQLRNNGKCNLFAPSLALWGAFMNRLRVVKPRFLLLVVAAFVAVFVVTFFIEGGYIARQKEKIAELEGVRASAVHRLSESERKIDFAKTDEYIERTARENLGLLKPGQVRYVPAGK